MTPPPRDLRADALRIWRAGVEAVLPERLFAESLHLDGSRLLVATPRGDEFDADLAPPRRVLVVGGGKAGAGMARGLEAALAPLGEAGRLAGLLSVPADCVPPTRWVRLVPGRPPGVNEPRPEGAAAVEAMLAAVANASPDDLVVCLLSGGGSALLPAPLKGVTLDDKVAVARLLAAAGANIEELNTVRQHLSRFKGGGLARACRPRTLLTLVLSDVLGDPLDLIASGPTTPPTTTPDDALAVLERLDLAREPSLAGVVTTLRARSGLAPPLATSRTTTLVLANNAAAIDAAGVEAERLGYRHVMHCAGRSEGRAEEVGRHLAELALRLRDAPEPAGADCLITGGEPTVALAPAEVRGRGGRNQQLALAALQTLGDCRGVALAAGATDGEDGPTDAAGALIDEGVAARLSPAEIADALRRNDAYPLLERAGALLKTGPTHTNVCDVRVVTIARP